MMTTEIKKIKTASLYPLVCVLQNIVIALTFLFLMGEIYVHVFSRKSKCLSSTKMLEFFVSFIIKQANALEQLNLFIEFIF